MACTVLELNYSVLASIFFIKLFSTFWDIIEVPNVKIEGSSATEKEAELEIFFKKGTKLITLEFIRVWNTPWPQQTKPNHVYIFD